MTQIEWLELAKENIGEVLAEFSHNTYSYLLIEKKNKLDNAISYINEAIELGKEANDVKK